MALPLANGPARGSVRLERVAAHEVARTYLADEAELSKPLAHVFDAAAAAVPDDPFVISSVRPED